ncbi:MAG: glycosyltransferase [Verrucomicrobia bacterium]|nr:glycosyltransferase [Verrucomicrobiota bacterium]
MKILELGKFYWPSKGGMETLLLAFCRGFHEMGHQVECVVSNESPKLVVENVDGVPVRREAQFGQLLSTSLSPGYFNACRRSQADVWHHHFPNPLADVATLLGRKSTPMILSYHSDVIRQKAAMRFYKPLMNRTLDRAQKIVVATPYHFDYSPWLQPYESKVVVIPYGIELGSLALQESDAPEIEKLKALANGETIFLNVGRLVGYKGQEYLIRALKHAPGVAWIVGKGPLEEELQKLTHELGLENRVKFWGAVSEEELRRLIHASDVFAFPSITPNEAFGLVQAEAMACSKPVICANLKSGVPYVNRHGETGLVVEPADERSLADAMTTLGQDPQLRAQLGAKAKERAFGEFERGVMLRRYMDLMTSLM